MMKPLTFERMRDDEGSVVVGWAGDSVVYARIEGGLSGELGARLAAHLEKLVVGVSGVHYFADASRVTRYDLLARSAFVRVALANRRRFESFTFLLWPAEMSAATHAFAAAIGQNVELCQDMSDFERRLLRHAPLARHRIEQSGPERLDATARFTR
ncbi:MAG TPA: hypothetical protein VMI54_30395 [Polyangiaceae bacterium]|nr:hypothetical protein [Polyangiaceae bacterium]